MKKYYCKNGEAVWVYPNRKNPKQIFVKYKGKIYERPISAIGKTLFSKKPNTVDVGSKVNLKNADTNDVLVVQIVPTKVEAKYRGMGGSYYGARVDLVHTLDNSNIADGIIAISKNSPIGKAVLGKVEGDTIIVRCPDNRVVKYCVLSIESPSK